MSRISTVIAIATAALVSTALTVHAPAASAQAASSPGITTGVGPGISTADLLYWNNSLLEAVRREANSTSFGPTNVARATAVLNASMWDTLVSFEKAGYFCPPSVHCPTPGRYQAYAAAYTPEGGTNTSLTLGLVGRNILTYLLPAEATYFQSQYSARYGSLTESGATNFSTSIVTRYKSVRGNDGSTNSTTYKLDGVPGSWRPTGGSSCPESAGGGAATTPNFGQVKPFILTSPSQFRQPLPGGYSTYASLLSSALYAQNVTDVQKYGSNSTSSPRTAYQTQTAYFWANDGSGTYRPPGQLLQTTEAVISAQSASLFDAARELTTVSFALADASIAAWDQKFATALDIWRPISAIRNADLDGTSATVKDATWTPLDAATPCFPAWVSGHAEFAGAWSKAMASLFGDQISFTVRTDDPNAKTITRTYSSFTAAATEMAISRFYYGVHFKFDADAGLASGQSVGNFVVANWQDLNPNYVDCSLTYCP